VYVTMDIQKLEHRVEIIMKVNNVKILSRAASNDMYASLDKAVSRIESQLRRYKKKIEAHVAKSTSWLDMNVNILRPQREYDLDDLNDEIEEENDRRMIDNYRPHEIVAQEKKPLKVLSYDEAIMKLELSHDVFLIFRHEEDHKLKVIYQRNDGNYGIIEPEA
jgi:putative sigma-54 modulation protein